MPYSVIKKKVGNDERYFVKNSKSGKVYPTKFHSSSNAQKKIKIMEEFEKKKGKSEKSSKPASSSKKPASSTKSKSKKPAVKNGRHQNPGRPKGSKNKVKHVESNTMKQDQEVEVK